MPTQSPSVFISYSHKDANYLDALKTVLAPLEQYHGLAIWSDRQI